jgi:hypothetical protein
MISLGLTSCPASPDQDPLPRIDFGLTVKRRMVAELGDDHMRNGRFRR